MAVKTHPGNGISKKRRSEAAKKAWVTMRRNGTIPHRNSGRPAKIDIRPGSDGCLMASRLLAKGIPASTVAEVTGQPESVVRAIRW